MVKLPKYCWILLNYCKKIDLQPNNHLAHHEPPPSLITSGELEVHEPNSSSPIVITSSRLHEMNGTLFHRSWTRDHQITSSMERSKSCAPHHPVKAQQDGVVQKDRGRSTLCGHSVSQLSIESSCLQLHRLKLETTIYNNHGWRWRSAEDM